MMRTEEGFSPFVRPVSLGAYSSEPPHQPPPRRVLHVVSHSFPFHGENSAFPPFFERFPPLIIFLALIVKYDTNAPRRLTSKKCQPSSKVLNFFPQSHQRRPSPCGFFLPTLLFSFSPPASRCMLTGSPPCSTGSLAPLHPQGTLSNNHCSHSTPEKTSSFLLKFPLFPSPFSKY